MTDIPGTDAAAALRRCHDKFAVDVTVTGAGLSGATVKAVPSNRAGDAFQGPGRSARTIAWTFMAADLPSAPTRGMTIDDGTTLWRVVDIENLGGSASFRLVVEAAS